MRHWWQLGIRNWWVKPGRTTGALTAIALGVGVVVWVTCAYESVRLAIDDQVRHWIGESDLSVESVYGPTGTVYQVIASQVEELPNIKAVTYRLRRRMTLYPGEQEQPSGASSTQPAADRDTTEHDPFPGPLHAQGMNVEVVGIVPEREYRFRDYDAAKFGDNSRRLRPDDTHGAMMEEKLARQLDLHIGDAFTLETEVQRGLALPERHRERFELVGLIEHRRVAKQQLPLVVVMFDRVRELARLESGTPLVTKIDIQLEQRDTTSLLTTQNQIRRIVDRYRQGFMVTSTAGRRMQVEKAQEQTGFVLAMISSVALFTGFFIILSTLSMGMVERIGQLGMLRCLGVTRLGLSLLVLSEAVPIGLVGIVLGLPIGFAFTKLSMWFAPEYIGHFEISETGILLALVGGAVTTLAGALLPMFQAMFVSPLQATRSHSRPARAWLTWIAAGLGAAMIYTHVRMINELIAPEWFKWQITMLGVSLLYVGYALLTPAIITIVGSAVTVVAAVLMGVSRRLLAEQIGRAAWRSGTICCGLMVGLSLIVSMITHSTTLAHGWNFPKDFAEAFVFTYPPIERDRADRIRRTTPGIKSSTLVNESIKCTVYTRSAWFSFPISRFVAGDPEEFFEITRLQFVEGDKDEAIAKLKQGGYVLVTPEFMRAKRLNFEDEPRVTVNVGGAAGRSHMFGIAGVVTSPALDIAANYFNAGGLLVQQSVFVVLGTFDDADRYFGLPQRASMFLLNFDFPYDDPGPPAFQESSPPSVRSARDMAELLIRWKEHLPERHEEITRIEQQLEVFDYRDIEIRWSNVPSLQLLNGAFQAVARDWSKFAPEQRWRNFREEMVMRLIAAKSNAADHHHASVGALKAQIDRELRRATALFTSVPMVALIVAGLGVANLMMANVASRARQWAMLRAVGTTRWQVIRLVLGEAFVLGALGSLMGVVLGWHVAYDINTLTEAIWGFDLPTIFPWGWVAGGIAFTLGVCFVAGILPARYAARTNIINALQTT